MSTALSTVSFVLDGQLTHIDFTQSSHRPTQTLLWYLRSLATHKDVKEGCAEGDCGACTIVLAEPDSAGKMQYKAYDSCLILLPMIHGKWVITANGIGSSDAMHPVQQAMVNTDGSQCGYCTPGFIMSLFALYKNHENPSREVINDALTGNLCRCTGYRSIVQAAEESCASTGADKLTALEGSITATLKSISTQSLEITTSDQRYFRPATLPEALRLKDTYPEARLLQGATDLGLLVTKQKQLLPAIIDLSAIDALRKVEYSDTGYQFGSGTSLETVKGVAETHYPALFDMLAVFGSLQIRNLASFGGNLASASPIGDTPPVLMAYDASVHVASVDGPRTIKAVDFITGYRKTALRNNELITAVDIPFTGDARVNAYKISKRKDLDISTVSAGFRLEMENDQIADLRLVYGGMAAQTQRARKTESYLRGKPWTRENVEAAMPLVDEDFTPISDARSGAEGRKVMARNLLLKFWVDTANA